jgi:hypothetical protein
LDRIIESLTFPPSSASAEAAHVDTALADDSIRFDAVRATAATAAAVSFWSPPASGAHFSFRGCGSRPFAVTLLKVLERALDDSCPHDLLLMVTGIYARLGGVAVDGILELFVDGSSKNVIAVLEQLSARASAKWASLSKPGGSGLPDASGGHADRGGGELSGDQRFVRACVTIVQFCMELKA